MNSADLDTPLTDPDRDVLAFLAAHPLVLTAHVRTVLGVDGDAANTRLGSLAARELASHVRVTRRAGYHQITQLGLAKIDSDMPPPRVNLARCRHDIALAWVALAAQRGAFGRVEHVLTRRQQQSRDASHTTNSQELERDPRYGIPLADGRPSRATGLHYPDLLLTGHGDRVAVELILTPDSQRHREEIMASYKADRILAAVMYLTDSAPTRDAIHAAADRLGIADHIHVRPVAAPPAAADSAA